jgi:phage recombination protein Bet
MDNTEALAISEKQINSLTIQEVGKLWAPGVSPKEFELFIGICKAYNLNPFKREIHIIKYAEAFPASIVVGYEVYIKRAERSGDLDGWSIKTEGEIPNLKAVLTIHRKSWKLPFTHEVYYSEIVGKKKDGTITAIWIKQPKFMSKKCCIGQGFRLAFPDELGGMPFLEEEAQSIDEIELIHTKPAVSHAEPVEAEVVKTETVVADALKDANKGVLTPVQPPVQPMVSDNAKKEPEKPKEFETSTVTPPLVDKTEKKVGEPKITSAQIRALKFLVESTPDQTATNKWIAKEYKVETYSEMTERQALTCIEFMQKKLAK